MELHPIPNKASKNIAEWFYKDIICRHGAPAYVCTDRGTEFLGNLSKLLHLLNILVIKISSGYP